jgi:hypothetical protein
LNCRTDGLDEEILQVLAAITENNIAYKARGARNRTNPSQTTTYRTFRMRTVILTGPWQPSGKTCSRDQPYHQRVPGISVPGLRNPGHM